MNYIVCYGLQFIARLFSKGFTKKKTWIYKVEFFEITFSQERIKNGSWIKLEKKNKESQLYTKIEYFDFFEILLIIFRGLGVGICVFCTRVGGVIAPQILLLVSRKFGMLPVYFIITYWDSSDAKC